MKVFEYSAPLSNSFCSCATLNSNISQSLLTGKKCSNLFFLSKFGDINNL